MMENIWKNCLKIYQIKRIKVKILRFYLEAGNPEKTLAEKKLGNKSNCLTYIRKKFVKPSIKQIISLSKGD